MGPILALRGLYYCSSWIRSRGVQGPPWVPEGRKSIDKFGAGFIFSSSLRSAHIQRETKIHSLFLPVESSAHSATYGCGCNSCGFNWKMSEVRSGWFVVDLGQISVRRADFGALPVAIRPKVGPEDRFPARKHYCVK